ncbi:hypothetical protein CLOBOL_01604 [Enterocloster bolteae ATCC BAA-613]|uniref:Uncharacterized protein n=1 Tax=Enterocloster bolteae (strain ATCC BAA-613 / DSM 15670 / CCUG 46953 / JCM 12243 / WAL 16351) TaxID=411902 RepID=A8RLF7_ENTBW|nr:hypothetical protein CLOBOL_01604 [Enterocloster bolteae ATCC BAA-613]
MENNIELDQRCQNRYTKCLSEGNYGQRNRHGQAWQQDFSK